LEKLLEPVQKTTRAAGYCAMQFIGIELPTQPPNIKVIFYMFGYINTNNSG